MESITTTVVIETHNYQKAEKLVKSLIKKGYRVERNSKEFHPYKDKYIFELTKLEEFK